MNAGGEAASFSAFTDCVTPLKYYSLKRVYAIDITS